MQRITQALELDRINAGKKTAVLFHATWCPFCVRYKPTFDQETQGLQAGWEPVDCVIDDESNPLWARYNIEIVPTVLLFEDGKLVKRVDGAPGRGLKPGQTRDLLKGAGALPG